MVWNVSNKNAQVRGSCIFKAMPTHADILDPPENLIRSFGILLLFAVNLKLPRRKDEKLRWSRDYVYGMVYNLLQVSVNYSLGSAWMCHSHRYNVKCTVYNMPAHGVRMRQWGFLWLCILCVRAIIHLPTHKLCQCALTLISMRIKKNSWNKKFGH